MKRKIPEITQRLMKSIRENAKKGVVRYVVNGIKIDIFPYVFPPESSFSGSSDIQFNKLTGKTVLDIGTGTGILAIRAALAGAKTIHAVDIFNDAVNCAIHNIKLNKLYGKIDVYKSDIFSHVPRMKFDIIIANLPILNLPQDDIRFHSLFDPGFEYRRRLFEEGRKYLKKNGRILFSYADFFGDVISELEQMAESHGYSFALKNSAKTLGYEWRVYEFWLSAKGGKND